MFPAWTSEMMTAALCAKLRRTGHPYSIGGASLFNPDGPEAADTIEAQAKEIARLTRERDEAEVQSAGWTACAEAAGKALTLADQREARLRDALRVAEGGWQPIETAPKDSTKIDVWQCGERIPDVYWSDVQDGWCIDGSYGPEEPTPLAIFPGIVGWRPLPAPPVLKDSDTAAQGEGNRS